MRLTSRLAALSLVATTAATCAAPDGSDGTPQRGGTVTMIELADISKPMSIIAETTLDNEVVGTIFMALLSPRWEDGELHYLTADRSPLALTKRYEHFGPDSASIRYHMRGDLTWSDGIPITAHDAVWTLQMQGDERVASPRQDYNRQITSVVAEDDSTLVVNFATRYPEMLFHTAGEVMPSHVFDDSDPSQLRSHPAVNDPTGGNLPVSGPYQIGEWQRGQRVVLVPNPDFEPAPLVQRMVFVIIPEETTRMVEFQTGNADMLELPFDKIPAIREMSNVRLESQERRFYDYIAYNPLAHPALADRDVRRALGLAIDVPSIIESLQLDEFAEPAGGPYSPLFRHLYDPVGQAPIPYDPDEARAILESKGWVAGPDGIRSMAGDRLSFTVGTNSGNQRRADIAQIVQQQWRQVGVEVNIQTAESNTFYDGLTRRDFDIAIAGWGVGLAADISDAWSGDGPFNFTSYDNPDVNALFEQALAQETEEAAAQHWRQAASLIVADQPYTWLFYFDLVVGVNDRVADTRVDTLGKYQNLHEWWVTTL